MENEIMAGRINGILFDLGDTLLDFGRVDISSLFEAGARMAYKYLQDINQPLPSFAAYHRKQLWAIRWNYFKSRFTRREFNALELLGRLAGRMGQNLSPAQTLELAQQWYRPLGQCAKCEPHLPELLAALSDSGLKLGVISNTFVPAAVLDGQLQAAGLLDLLPVRVYSCDVGFRKPNRKIFQIALDRCGLLAGGTLFVGDSPKADIAGANRMGMISVLKDPADRHANSRFKPAHRIRQMAELPAIIAKYNG